MVHSSFSLNKPVLARIEVTHAVKLSIVTGGDAGEMLNKLILTRAKPIADVVYGLDNTLVGKALAAGVLEPVLPQMSGQPDGQLGAALAPVDYGYGNLNVDKAEVAKRGVALPGRLEDWTIHANGCRAAGHMSG